MMTTRTTYRVYDNRTGRVTTVPAAEVSAYERALWAEADRQAYRSPAKVR